METVPSLHLSDTIFAVNMLLVTKIASAKTNGMLIFVSKMMKRIVALIVLLAFGMLTAPRSFMHECDHHAALEHSDSHDHDSDSSELDEDCAACHYDLDAATKPLSFQYQFTKPLYSVSAEVSEDLIHQRGFGVDYLRGPPTA